mgnify:CR=1 FL=1
MLNAEYFQRIDALNYSMFHDDGQHVEGLEEADAVLIGVSRTSKTPTSIYLANRGVKTANFPLVPGMPVPLATSVTVPVIVFPTGSTMLGSVVVTPTVTLIGVPVVALQFRHVAPETPAPTTATYPALLKVRR